MQDAPAAEVGRKDFNAAELGAVAHLYRAEVYRSTVWRQRLDTTTNWSVVTLGIALSITFASPQASAVPLVLVGVLIIFFLTLEARRYRFFNVWRARCRWLETHFYAPMLVEGDLHLDEGWQRVLADDYLHPRYHVSLMVAIGRRIRRNYLWILLIQAAAYLCKLVVHPDKVATTADLLRRADLGPVPGEVMLALGALYVATWSGIAIWSKRHDARLAHRRRDSTAMG